ncbi:hypothetical protein N7495_005598 [Penicillium taxi]|uniref:uncharacterized protein n=1 Tax=Penicillium taxi TaxID=168475 RepID=UPI0025456826|nr:uncharacterized protein N7495_005598 [Penicillium taxi]KAJ5893907.1 hypothetical protein N7495_005598 [Penicillium taxi]
MDLFTAKTAIKFALPPMGLFELPPSQLHKPAARLPLPPTDTSAAKLFQPFMIKSEAFRFSLDLKFVLTFVTENQSFNRLCLVLVSTNSKSVWEGGGGYLTWIFYISKFYEVVDTLIILARGKKSSALQTYHHAGVIICGWAVIRYESPLGFLGVVLNAGIYTLMFTIQSLGISISMGLKRTLTSLQIVQFTGGGGGGGG